MKPHDIRFEGGNGNTMASAIIVRGAQSDLEGTYAAYAWLVNKYGKKDEGWKLVSHSHGVFNGRDIDTFKIQFPDGTERVVFFDCSESFGKFWPTATADPSASVPWRRSRCCTRG